jgi:hypothetical protein
VVVGLDYALNEPSMTKPKSKRGVREVRAWCIPPLRDEVSYDGWTFFYPVFLKKNRALEMASKELVVPCTITYSLPKPKK